MEDVPRITQRLQRLFPDWLGRHQPEGKTLLHIKKSAVDPLNCHAPYHRLAAAGRNAEADIGDLLHCGERAVIEGKAPFLGGLGIGSADFAGFIAALEELLEIVQRLLLITLQYHKTPVRSL